MSLTELFAAEMEQESQTTRKMLSRIPDDKFDWRPHPKSMTIRQLATHIADLPSWTSMALKTTELDFAGNPYQPAVVNTTAEVLDLFEQSLAFGKAGLSQATDEQLEPIWTLREGDQIYSQSPRRDVIRMSFSQTVHHRAQLGVYLRLLDIPIPGSYGPSADDPSF